MLAVSAPPEAALSFAVSLHLIQNLNLYLYSRHSPPNLDLDFDLYSKHNAIKQI